MTVERSSGTASFTGRPSSPKLARTCMLSPSARMMSAMGALQIRAAVSTIASSTGWSLSGERLITLSTSPVAV